MARPKQEHASPFSKRFTEHWIPKTDVHGQPLTSELPEVLRRLPLKPPGKPQEWREQL